MTGTEPTISEQIRQVTDLTRVATAALKEHGEYSREHRQAVLNLASAERRLHRAEYEKAERDRINAMTPANVVDEVMKP